MLVVIFDPRPSSRPHTFADGMGVVETQKALTVTVVQSQGVVQPMRLLRCRWNLFNLELDPEAVLHDKRLTIELEKGVEARVSIHYLISYHRVIR